VLDPVVIVGAGIAGLSTALSIHGREVIVLCRGALGHCGATCWAQGGIAAPWGANDSADQHAQDTLRTGAWHGDARAVALLSGSARAAIQWLVAQGVAFDRGSDGEFSLCLEGGHGRHRILHAGGDASGRLLLSALARKALAARDMQVVEHAEVTGLLMAQDRVAGIRLRDRDGRSSSLRAAAVVLATGGIGGLYRWASAPPESDGSGLALGMLAGAATRDLEFMQFHPTALAHGGSSQLPLISEAVRGAGATLVDADGRPLMKGIDPRGDLAARDIVARTVFVANRDGRGAFLDATHIGARWPQRFPTVFGLCTDRGIDPRRDRLPVTPAAHFHMGGLSTDLDGRTTVPGLFAIGEVACNGVHGANRLASNSLLEGVVFGRRLGRWLSQSARPGRRVASVNAVTAAPADADQLQILRDLMWSTAGPLREATALQDSIDRLRSPVGPGTTLQGTVALAVMQGALGREASLGAHARMDRSPRRIAAARAEAV
jgi:L-aspartate oxidase